MLQMQKETETQGKIGRVQDHSANDRYTLAWNPPLLEQPVLTAAVVGRILECSSLV